MDIVSLFCGAGGLSLGFAQDGFLTAFAKDIGKLIRFENIDVLAGASLPGLQQCQQTKAD